MGTIISYSEFKRNVDIKTSALIVYCFKYDNHNNVTISINKILASKLLSCKADRRTMRVDRFFNEILETLPAGSILKDFDVMFNPMYKVDVLRIMEIAYKRKKFSIVWPGIFNDGKLTYAELGYKDYKIFNIDEYDVICIV